MTRVARETESWLASIDGLRETLLEAGEGITVQDLSGRLVFANRAAARAMGFDGPEDVLDLSQGELLSRFELLDGDGQPMAPDRLPGRRALRGEPDEEALVRFRVRATGKEHWAMVRPTLVRDSNGAPRYVISAFHDVTDLKVTEGQLQLLADAGAILGRTTNYQETLNELAFMVVRNLADWCVVDVVEPMGGPRRVAVAHVDPAKLQLAAEVQERYPTARNQSLFERVLATGEPVLIPRVSDEQLAQAAVDEEHASYLRVLGLRSVVVVPLSARGLVLGAMSLIRSESSPAFGASDLPLIRELAARAANAVDNARLLNDANDALRMRDDFMAVASHDMRSPLAAMLGYLQLALRRLRTSGDLDRNKLIEYLASAETMTDRLRDLVDDLMDLSLIRSGRPIPLEQVPLDFCELARVAVEEHAGLAPARAFRLLTPDEPVIVQGDLRRLERVVDNLVDNAVKFSPDDGEIAVRVDRTPTEGRLAVVDRGRGIPSSEQDDVFEPYRRASNASGVRGSGLGLGASRAIVRQLGGEIDMESVEGEGSTFTIRLPLASPG